MQPSLQNHPLGTKPITPLLLKLSIPSIISMFIQALYNVVDSIFVAKIDSNALAALSLAFPIQLILIAIGVGTGIGTSSLISRLLGAKNEQRACNVAEHVLLISIIYGIIVFICGLFLSSHFISIFTHNTTLIHYGSEYIRVILIGSFAIFIPTIANNILRGEGNTFIPMLTMLIGSILNIILDPFLIFGYGFFPKLGIKGAALATVLSRIISGTFILYILFRGKNQIKLNFKFFRYDPKIIKEIYQVGLPAMTMQFLSSFMIAGFNKILSGYGSTAIAALGIYFRIQSFVFMPVFGLNQGFMPIMGYNYGHKNIDRMKKTIKATMLIAFIFTSLGCILLQIFPKSLIALFDQDKDLLRIGTDALKIISIAFPIIGPEIIGSTTFQAIGKGFPSLLLSFNRQIIILLPIGMILSHLGGLDAIWYAFPISELFTFFLTGFWLRHTLKKVFLKMHP